MALKLILSLVFFFSTPAFAEVYVFQVSKISLEEYRILNHRDPYFDYIPEATGEMWTTGGAFNLNMNVLRWDNYVRLFWDNRIHMESTESQLRSAGWEFRAGLNIYNMVRLFWHHHSQHLLDATPDIYTRNYPLWDSYNIELIIKEL